MLTADCFRELNKMWEVRGLGKLCFDGHMC